MHEKIRGVEGLFKATAKAVEFFFGRTDSEVRLGRAGRYAFGYYDKHPCCVPWTHSLVDFNGNVYVCCMTRERVPPLGNIRHQSFREIWEGAAYRQMRLKMHPPALAACRRCDDFLNRIKIFGKRLGLIKEKSTTLRSTPVGPVVGFLKSGDSGLRS